MPAGRLPVMLSWSPATGFVSVAVAEKIVVLSTSVTSVVALAMPAGDPFVTYVVAKPVGRDSPETTRLSTRKNSVSSPLPPSNRALKTVFAVPTAPRLKFVTVPPLLLFPSESESTMMFHVAPPSSEYSIRKVSPVPPLSSPLVV